MLLTNTLIRDYLLNYARPLIYTTSLSNLAVIAASCSFDLLENGTADRVGLSSITKNLTLTTVTYSLRRGC